jgi:hypothetical protein
LRGNPRASRGMTRLTQTCAIRRLRRIKNTFKNRLTFCFNFLDLHLILDCIVVRLKFQKAGMEFWRTDNVVFLACKPEWVGFTFFSIYLKVVIQGCKNIAQINDLRAIALLNRCKKPGCRYTPFGVENYTFGVLTRIFKKLIFRTSEQRRYSIYAS